MATGSQSLWNLLVPRIRELCDPSAPWNRALWGVGTLVAIREVIESAVATWDHILTSDGALSDFKKNALNQTNKDVGLGAPDARARVHDLINKIAAKPSDDARTALAQLEQMVVRASTRYLSNWADALDSGSIADAEFEFAARSIASHILDGGLHQEHVLGWIDSRGPKLATAELVREAAKLGTDTEWTFWFGVTAVDEDVKRLIPEAIRIDADKFREHWDATTNSRTFEPVSTSVDFAVAITVRALDPFSALESATEESKRIKVRAALARGTATLEFDSRVVDVTSNKVRNSGRGPLLRVSSLEHRRLVVPTDRTQTDQQVDDALTMLAPHLQTTAGVSVATLWAACEGLMGRVDSSGISVADRVADIVACSFPRQEAYGLMITWQEIGSGDLQAAVRNPALRPFSRMRALVDHLRSEGDPGFTSPQDQAAIRRLLAIEADPLEPMKRVRSYLSAAFRRLYYQRNFVMHAAKFDSVSIATTTRVSPVLVAAALDPVVNARFNRQPSSPLELAARAGNELSLLGTDGGRDILTLLS